MADSADQQRTIPLPGKTIPTDSTIGATPAGTHFFILDSETESRIKESCTTETVKQNITDDITITLNRFANIVLTAAYYKQHESITAISEWMQRLLFMATELLLLENKTTKNDDANIV